MRRRLIWRSARSRASRRSKSGSPPLSAPTATWLMLKRMDLSSISPLRRRSAGTRQTPRRAASVGLRGRPRAVGKGDLAGARLLGPEEDAQQRGDARSLQPGEAHDLAGAGGEVDILELAAARPLTRICSTGRPSRGGGGGGKERLRARADHALDDLGNGEGGAIAGQHVRPLRVMVTRSEMAKTSSSRCET